MAADLPVLAHRGASEDDVGQSHVVEDGRADSTPAALATAMLAASGRSPPDEAVRVAIRVVVGEGSFLAREGLGSVLARLTGVKLVAVCSDLDSLRGAVEAERPDVVVTGIRMPPENWDEGILLANDLRSTHPDMGVVIISQYADPGYAIALLDAGSDRRAYLLKERVKDKEELRQAIETVAEGGSVIDPLVVEQLVAARREHEESRLSTLTPREWEILAMISEGRSNAAIASALAITKRAVERHVHSIFMKLGFDDSGDVSRRVKAALLYRASQPIA
jgi:DNA-binding NarL/FixJ family response regulator